MADAASHHQSIFRILSRLMRVTWKDAVYYPAYAHDQQQELLFLVHVRLAYVPHDGTEIRRGRCLQRGLIDTHRIAAVVAFLPNALLET